MKKRKLKKQKKIMDVCLKDYYAKIEILKQKENK